MKKILIIEPCPANIAYMACLFKAAGYEVLAIRTAIGPQDEGVTQVEEPQRIVELARTFQPQWTFLGHDLNLGDFTGANFAAESGFLTKSLIGTSTDFIQDYCGRRFRERSVTSQPASNAAWLAFVE